MSKGKKNIEVNLETKTINGIDCEYLSIGKQVIGYVRPSEDKFAAVFDDENIFKVKSIDEGIEILISQYNLHKG